MVRAARSRLDRRAPPTSGVSWHARCFSGFEAVATWRRFGHGRRAPSRRDRCRAEVSRPSAARRRRGRRPAADRLRLVDRRSGREPDPGGGRRRGRARALPHGLRPGSARGVARCRGDRGAAAPARRHVGRHRGGRRGRLLADRRRGRHRRAAQERAPRHGRRHRGGGPHPRRHAVRRAGPVRPGRPARRSGRTDGPGRWPSCW